MPKFLPAHKNQGCGKFSHLPPSTNDDTGYIQEYLKFYRISTDEESRVVIFFGIVDSVMYNSFGHEPVVVHFVVKITDVLYQAAQI